MAQAVMMLAQECAIETTWIEKQLLQALQFGPAQKEKYGLDDLQAVATVYTTQYLDQIADRALSYREWLDCRPDWLQSAIFFDKTLADARRARVKERGGTFEPVLLAKAEGVRIVSGLDTFLPRVQLRAVREKLLREVQRDAERLRGDAPIIGTTPFAEQKPASPSPGAPKSRLSSGKVGGAPLADHWPAAAGFIAWSVAGTGRVPPPSTLKSWFAERKLSPPKDDTTIERFLSKARTGESKPRAEPTQADWAILGKLVGTWLHEATPESFEIRSSVESRLRSLFAEHDEASLNRFLQEARPPKQAKRD